MPKLTRYAAIFPDGVIITRSSYRTYTHAWRVTYKRAQVQGTKDFHREWNAIAAKGVIHSDTGFSSSAELARKAARVGGDTVIVDVFVVPVVVD